ncbi:prepilin peptidase [Roseovarius autotrophicus]|uniref:prepilin peptidase n=1 Tax=Roseovarius autotrophicus TaxID=2824121 RepID=UPI001A0596C2|nr:prepilin peptidase [Roseovarius autotrophicus]MBE0454148.1 prepilin peptidase [Roseovarius sp.]
MAPLDAAGLIAGLVAVAGFCHVAQVDFRTLKIRNASVLALCGLYVLWAAAGGFRTLGPDLIAGGLLFLIGLVMWFARMMGAGDVKLYFPLGLFIGFELLAWYAVLLLVASVLFVAALALAGRSKATSGIMARLKAIRETRKLPYAVPMVMAGAPVIVMRLLDFG